MRAVCYLLARYLELTLRNLTKLSHVLALGRQEILLRISVRYSIIKEILTFDCIMKIFFKGVSPLKEVVKYLLCTHHKNFRIMYHISDEIELGGRGVY